MKSIITLAALVLSSMSFAATEEVKTMISQPEINKSSAQNRVGNSVSLSAQPFGLNPSGVVGSGVTIGFHITPNALIQMEFTAGKVKDRNGWLYDDLGDVTKREGYSAGVHYKQFVGNSFYIKAGSDYRTVKFKEVNDWWPTNLATERGFKGESFTAAFGVGNQWQFGAFTLGCDWFGVQIPLTAKVYDETYSSEWDREDNKDDQEWYVKGVSVTALRLSVGASF